MIFLECGRHLVYFLELRWGWPFETRVCSAKSGRLSNYDAHLAKLQRGGWLMSFLELRQAPRVYSRVTAGMAI